MSAAQNTLVQLLKCQKDDETCTVSRNRSRAQNSFAKPNVPTRGAVSVLCSTKDLFLNRANKTSKCTAQYGAFRLFTTALYCAT